MPANKQIERRKSDMRKRCDELLSVKIDIGGRKVRKYTWEWILATLSNEFYWEPDTVERYLNQPVQKA